MSILSNDIIEYIFEFVRPTKKQMEEYKFNHFINGYWLVLEDIKNLVIIVDLNEQGEKIEFLSLFNWVGAVEYYYINS